MAKTLRLEEQDRIVVDGDMSHDGKANAQQALSQAVQESVGYRLLAARFRALFTWPAVLSGLPVMSVSKRRAGTDMATPTASCGKIQCTRTV